MTASTLTAPAESDTRSAQDWVRLLAKYRDPNTLRSIYELAVSLGPFLALWALSWWTLSISYWLTAGIALVNAAFLVRLFAIQHDCGHASFFRNREANNWVGRALGVLTLTPYDVWKRSHAIHHSAAGNLDRRGIGDVHTLTVAEYHKLSRKGRLLYRLYRSPVVMFGLGPTYLFGLQNRLPFGLMRAGAHFWVSAMGTNLAIATALFALYWFGGLMPVVLIFLPTTIMAATLGVWLFYVQHQFEDTHWNSEPDWTVHDAALNGSSHYDLPGPLRWMTANLGVHHVHHLYSRIPFYRLPEVLRDYPVLATAQRMTLCESFANARLHLWDENERRLRSFAAVRRSYGAV